MRRSPKSASGQNLRLQLVLLPEKQALSYSDFSSGAHQALPFIGVARQLAESEELRSGRAENRATRGSPG